MEELTFDYQFQRFGLALDSRGGVASMCFPLSSDVAQRCYCGAASCRGFLGQTKQAPASMRVLSQPAEPLLSSPVGSPQSPSATSRRRGKQQRLQNPADSAVSSPLMI